MGLYIAQIREFLTATAYLMIRKISSQFLVMLSIPLAVCLDYPKFAGKK